MCILPLFTCPSRSFKGFYRSLLILSPFPQNRKLTFGYSYEREVGQMDVATILARFRIGSLDVAPIYCYPDRLPISRLSKQRADQHLAQLFTLDPSIF